MKRKRLSISMIVSILLGMLILSVDNKKDESTIETPNMVMVGEMISTTEENERHYNSPLNYLKKAKARFVELRIEVEEYLKKEGDWEAIGEIMQGDKMLGHFAITNQNGYFTKNYEFYEKDMKYPCKAVIIVKDNVTRGQNFKQVLIVPIEKSEYIYLKDRIVQMKDLNFDGYYDLIYNSTITDLECYMGIAYLWSPINNTFEYASSFPERIGYVNGIKNRLQYASGYAEEEEYQIFEYIEGEFVETKRLERKMPYAKEPTEADMVETYYEYGKEIIEVKIWLNNDKPRYECYEDVMLKESGFVENYSALDIIRNKYYPEIDFYMRG